MEVYEIQSRISNGLRRTLREILFSAFVVTCLIYLNLPEAREVGAKELTAVIFGIPCGALAWSVFRILRFALLPSRR